MKSERVSWSSRSAILFSATLVGVFGTAAGVRAQALKDLQIPDTPLVLKAQGSFFVGGEKAEQTEVELGSLGPGGHIAVNAAGAVMDDPEDLDRFFRVAKAEEVGVIAMKVVGRGALIRA